jgi:Ran GTPase-activating protein (RanGAP) involved in mRNA processing and transport
VEEVAEEIDPEIMKVRHYKLATKMAQVRKEFKGDTMDISQNKIGHLFIEDNKSLLGELVRLEKLRILDLSYNLIDDKGLAMLSKICGTMEGLIPKNLPLKELRLRHNRLTYGCHLCLLPFFHHLDVLDLSENPLTDSFIRELFISLPSDTTTFTISNLSMQSCSLSNLSMHLLSQHLSVFPSL